ncbi:hypothetical protein FBU30_002376 [Linnemannia zychae]|nr:hypothetical protein FBU30_002376 [Linnemannia zychae]
MANQTFAIDDLKTQLIEIQEVLDRVNPKQENMTSEEREIIQNAQMMKDLAEEVIATKLASTSQSNERSIQDHHPKEPVSLSLSLPSPGHPFDPTEAPPPTAVTPPPTNAFQRGHLRHKSSTASITSTAGRSYTPEGDESTNNRHSRPSSASSVRRLQLQKKKSRQSLRQLDGGNQGSSKYQEESNAAFDRICSLLTDLITDASTAVSTAPDGSLQPSNIPLPQFLPLVTSDSELSAHNSASDTDEDIDNDDQDSKSIESTVPQDEFMKRLQGPEGVPPIEELELEIEDPIPSVRYRRGLRSRYDQPTKRLSSLFMELSNTQKTTDETQDDLSLSKISSETKERSTRKPRHSTSSLSISSTRSSRPSSIFVSTNARQQSDFADLDNQSLSPKTERVPRHRNSMSSMRSSRSSSRSDSLPNDLEVQQVLQGVNSELDRTVETIDGLTRDLVAVATHQNWMHMKLQKSLHFQKQQVEKIDRAYSNSTASYTLSATQEMSHRSLVTATVSNDPMEQHHPLADLSRSLKQVAVSVGKVLANNTSSIKSRKRLVENHREPSESNNNTIGTQGNRLTTSPANSKEFKRYFQELEKVAAIGGKIGFDKTEVDGIDTQELLGEPLDQHHHQQEKQSPRSGDEAQHHENDQNETFSKGSGQHSTHQSRRGSSASSGGPPELEDFAAQCRLLTRALVLPFVQLTHHAMTSQDSALALTPRNSRFKDQTSSYEGTTMEIIDGLEVSSEVHHSKQSSVHSSIGTRRSSLGNTSLHSSTPRDQKKSFSPLSSPLLSAAWTSSLPLNGRDLDSILRGHGSDLSPDAMVKARSVISTGLYLIHLLYWTVLFVIGTIVLDPWLAETAGRQVVRIVEQVRNVVATDGLIGSGTQDAIDDNQQNHLRQHSFEQQQRPHRISDGDLIGDQLSLDHNLRRLNPHWDTVDDDNHIISPDPARLQDLEDRAIEVAVGFESFKQRIGSNPSSRVGFRPGSSLWSRPNSFQSTASALTEATRTQSPESSFARSSQIQNRPLSQISVASSATTEGGVLRTINWAGPRRRRSTRDGNQARIRRYSNNARNVNLSFKVPNSEYTMPSVTLRQGPHIRRDRPQTHCGVFESSSMFATGETVFGLGHSRGSYRETSSSISSTVSSSTTLSEMTLPPYNSSATGADLNKINSAFDGAAMLSSMGGYSS